MIDTEMTNNEAHEFLRLYQKFMVRGAVKITDFDPNIGDVEIQVGDGRRYWTTRWSAAKVISANSS